MYRIDVPEKVEHIIDTLTAAGHEAYAVGGCVRDALLGREPADWDITTSASPYEVKALFSRTIDTGIQHGTVTVMLGKEGFEVTTYRVDGEYEDCRHPKEVQFTKSLLEDLKRRDFTINAMAYNPAEGLIDEFDGAGDLKRGIIRCVGDAEARFGEDALRMMRAVRLCENLRKVSAERIQTELVKMLVSPHPDRILEAWELGITGVMLPEFDACMACMQNNPHHMDTVGEHIANALQYVEPDKVLRLSMLLHDIGKPQTKTTDANGIDHFYGHAQIGEELTAKILRRLKFDNDTIRNVRRLVLHHDDRPATTSSSVRRAANRIGADLFPLYLNVCRADILAQTKETQESKLQNLSKIESIYERILEKQQCFTLKQLAVTGRDLIAEGIPAGPRLGEILEKLLEEVLEEPEKNEREWLMSRALEIYQENINL